MEKETKTVKNSSAERLAGLRRHSEEVNKLVVESLQQALLLLITKKPYDSITVTELCRKAGVSRMAFYGNFDNKDDIFRQIVSELHLELMSRVGSPLRQAPNVNWYVQLFEYVEEKSNVLQPIFNAGYREKYLQLVNSYILRHTELSDENVYLLLFWCGGVINAVSHWLHDNMRETPEQMANYCCKCFVNFGTRR